jgi:hypothetical protein
MTIESAPEPTTGSTGPSATRSCAEGLRGLCGGAVHLP